MASAEALFSALLAHYSLSTQRLCFDDTQSAHLAQTAAQLQSHAALRTLLNLRALVCEMGMGLGECWEHVGLWPSVGEACYRAGTHGATGNWFFPGRDLASLMNL